jgi:hypothetical protein
VAYENRIGKQSTAGTCVTQLLVRSLHVGCFGFDTSPLLIL